jgi:hypothetical protein
MRSLRGLPIVRGYESVKSAHNSANGRRKGLTGENRHFSFQAASAEGVHSHYSGEVVSLRAKYNFLI